MTFPKPIFFAAGVVLALAGCQNPGASRATENRNAFLAQNVDRTRFAPVRFAFESVEIPPREERKLDRVAAFMKTAPNKIIIAGFTDESGSRPYNLDLAYRRAEAVKVYLVRHGADANRLELVSLGVEMPASKEFDDAGWAKNRRVEIGVVR
jgi:outer membrane protein OmpA-like peptidoglycan-associated protein